MRVPRRVVAVLCVAAAALLWPPQFFAQAPVSPVPDLAGVRIGMTAQQAYDALKAHTNGAKISIGQNTIAGVSETPVPVGMAVKIDSKVPMETITVWLTTPPSKQVVWAIAQEMNYPDANKLLKGPVLDALRKKFGSDLMTVPVFSYWAFNQQGMPAGVAAQAGTCATRQDFSVSVAEPSGPTFPLGTPLIYAPGPPTPCDGLIEVRAQMRGPDNFVTAVSVTEVDRSLARSAREAYYSYLGNAGAREQQQEVDRAKQQKAPVF